MLRVLASWSTTLMLVAGALVAVTTSVAAAEELCPDGKFQTVIPGTDELICVAKVRPKREKQEAGSFSENGSNDPDPETIRKWQVQESIEFMCRQLNICVGDDAWKDSQCSMDADAPYGSGRGLPGERCPTYIRPDDEDGGGNDEPPTISPEQAAHQVIAKLKFTAAEPQVGPNRDHHDFPFDTAVGYPVWLWTTGGTASDSVTETVGPLTVSISIRLDEVVWDLGDDITLRCDTGTKWRKGTAPGKKSPTCGHVYNKPGKYTIEATSRWTITWTAGGQSGTMPYSITADRPFEVGEIHVLVR
jgi:hypothetical protein